MNYAKLNGTQRDVLTAVVAIEQDDRQIPNGHSGWTKPATKEIKPTTKRIQTFHEDRFGPISQTRVSGVLSELVNQSLSVKQRSESDGRVWIYRPTPEGHEVVSQALRERRRWITPPEPRPEHESQATLTEVLQA